ncbi:AEC family transporter [Roseomonas xinghualingensis]|uniref:AEC family transporter n=1 Tax=Roseomonas xinghualingensis TaxID=2986475 RepID=UPI0021F1999E|nr:AEC family transporter [Roseomonas sp. SXEYE001]MCV4206580.1 AEC family transporter [Roseomonas sp. SXEYE001]
MLGVLGLVTPVFLLIGLGYVAGLRRVISDEGLRGINDFAFWLCAPALLFVSAATGGGAGAHGGRLEIVFFGSVLIVYAVALLLSRLVARRGLAESGLFALNCSFGNTLMMGVPVVMATFGTPGIAPATAIIGLYSLVMMPLTTVVAELGLNAGSSLRRVLWTTLRSVLRNPIVMAVLLGNLWALLLPPPPFFARRFLEILGGGTSPMLLFCLGASLRDFQIRRDWADAAVINVLKLAVLPLLVWVLGQAAGLPPLELAVAVTLAAMPTGANAFLMSRRYAIGMERAGAAVLLGTIASVVTLTLVLGWIAMAPGNPAP